MERVEGDSAESLETWKQAKVTGRGKDPRITADVIVHGVRYVTEAVAYTHGQKAEAQPGGKLLAVVYPHTPLLGPPAFAEFFAQMLAAGMS